MDTDNTDSVQSQFQDDSYVTDSKSGENIPVQRDNANVKDPIDPDEADSDRQLETDEKEAIDKSNITKDRTRGAKPAGSYKEPGDEQGLGE